ncbi:MAG: cation transporter [Saprospiraceae bacterium]|nr:cation transporter [Saprospiraceae bacterium]
MTHEYFVSGMTCAGCVVKVKTQLEKIAGVTTAAVSSDGKVLVTMNRHIPTAELQGALQDFPQYQLSEAVVKPPVVAQTEEDIQRTFLETYKPILLVFGYILGATLLVEVAAGGFDWMRWMRHFMAGFFLVFSFFKMLDVPAFAASYSSYDVVARRWLGWGYAYPFVELTLGILFLINFNSLVTNGLAFIIMGISTVGVVQSLLAKRRFQCACLGAVFNLPMSNITLFEDVLMVAMSGAMLLVHA